MTPSRCQSESTSALIQISIIIVIGIPFLPSTSPWSKKSTIFITETYRPIHTTTFSASPSLPGCQPKKKSFADMNLCHEFTPNIPFFDAIRQSHQGNWRSCKGTSTPGDVTEEVKTWKQDMSCWRANAKSNMLPNNMLPGCLTRKKAEA